MIYSVLSLSALILAVGISGPHALEAVAQGGVGSGSAAAAQSVALETRLVQEAAQNAAQGVVIQGLQTQLSNTQSQLQAITTQLNNLLGNVTDLTNTVSSSASSTDTFQVSGHQIVTAKSTHGVPAVARCPAGKKVLGGSCDHNCLQPFTFGDYGAWLGGAPKASAGISTYTCQCVGGHGEMRASAICANAN